MKEKKIIIGALVIILICTLMFAVQKQKSKNNQGVEQSGLALIQSIQKTVEDINLEQNYEKKVLNNDKFLDHMTDGGGELTGYFKDGKVFKVTEKLGLSYGVVTYEYYFYNEELLLVKEKEENFPDSDNKGTLDYTKVELAFEGQHYFSDSKLLYSQSQGQKRFTQGLPEDLNKFIKMSQENIELLKLSY